MVGSTFVLQAEVMGYIDQSYTKLFSLLLQIDPDFFESLECEYLTNGTKNKFDLPDDFGYAQGVDYKSSSTTWLELREYNIQERNRYENSTTRGQARGYRIHGSVLELRPTPSANQTYRLVYVAAPVRITAPTQRIDGIAGYEEWVVLDVAMKMAMKEESDHRGILAERESERKRIEELISTRKLASNHHVTNLDSRARLLDPADYDQ